MIEFFHGLEQKNSLNLEFPLKKFAIYCSMMLDINKNS